MNTFYRSIGTTRQNFHQKMGRWLRFEEEKALLRPIIHQIRHDHPCMSARKIYLLVKPREMGRDVFERYCFSEDLRVRRVRSYHRTTDSRGVIRFDNLLTDLLLTGPLQVLVSDITYYQLGKEPVFITFIMDLHTRFIVGHQLSRRLTTAQTTIPALQKVIRARGEDALAQCIIHSDCGGQYYSKDFVAITRKLKMRNSMCLTALQNPNAERINGIIKNDYIIPKQPQTWEQLKRELDRAVHLYNTVRPHGSLFKHTPAQVDSGLVSLSTKVTLVNKEKSSKKESFTTTKTTPTIVEIG